MGAAVRIQGFSELKRKLKRFPPNVARRVNRKAVTAGTAILRQAVRDATPVDKGKTKKLEDSKISGKALSLKGFVGLNVTKLKGKAWKKRGDPTLRPSNIDYLLEFGHVTADGRFVPPTGFARTAAAAAMPRAEAKVVSVMARGIEEEALRS